MKHLTVFKGFFDSHRVDANAMYYSVPFRDTNPIVGLLCTQVDVGSPEQTNKQSYANATQSVGLMATRFSISRGARTFQGTQQISRTSVGKMPRGMQGTPVVLAHCSRPRSVNFRQV